MNARLSRKYFSALCLIAFALSASAAEGDFGFGDASEEDAAGSGIGGSGGSGDSSGVTVGGEAGATATAFADDLDGVDSIEAIGLGSLFAGKLDFSATGSNADAVIDLEVASAAEGESPISVGEAYVRAYWGKLDLEAGLRKIVWGKADSSGPLDVANPLDLSDLTVTDSLERKIARPMLHASYALGNFTKLEGVFEPSFEGHKLSLGGRWAPEARLNAIMDRAVAEASAALIASGMPAAAVPAALEPLAGVIGSLDLSDYSPETSSLKYAQAGIRFTTTIGSSDIGLQYYWGNLPTPAISVNVPQLLASYDSVSGSFDGGAFAAAYNRYHQIGADWASVIGKFNVRGEVAANITSDLEGDDGEVYNPAFLWSAGFDRDVFAGLNLNAQASGSVRLMDDKVGDTIADTEDGSDMTHTTVTAKLSRKFMKDEFEVGATALWGIEDADCLVMPSVVWTKGDTEVELSGGIFAGDEDGELGQYGDNDYVKLSVVYRF